jgi:hypothetical protein
METTEKIKTFRMQCLQFHQQNLNAQGTRRDARLPAE